MERVVPGWKRHVARGSWVVRWWQRKALRQCKAFRQRQALLGGWVRWARRKSPWVLHFNSGGCNGCDIEILDLLTPRYDVERLGILKEASPRHADILLCTGPVTRQSRDRLCRIYAQMPAPKWVVAVGSCSCSGGVFQGGANVLGGVDQVLPVDLYVPGCPCRPEAMIDGLAQLLEQMA